ncbi:MAG TPA: glycosyltransferase [Pyrinomonadaceae bacterium]|nr:glycosyltransferase [Pyrinomonadaceae bacterium]
MPSIKLLTVVEATTVNAVAKTVLDFYRTARELSGTTDSPAIEGCVATFDRQRDGAGPNDFVAAAREAGLDVEVIPERGRFDLRVIPALRSIVEKRGPDLIITNSVKSHFLIWRSRLWRKRPWIAFHHGHTDTDRKMRFYNRLDRWSLPHADRVVTVCQAFAQELSRSTGVSIDKISVQHNAIRRQPPVSTADVEVLRKSLGIADSERVVLSVGRLSREKAHVDLIEAFKRLRQTKPDLSIKLIIVGDGPERSRLEAAVEATGYEERVVFTGQLTDVQPFYAMADVFALPSHGEGSPNVLLEAMAANLPIVATAVGGVPEMIANDESALLVPPNDPQSLTTALATLLTDKDLAQRLTRKATTLVDSQHSPANYVRSLVQIYREVISTAARPRV